MHGLQRLAWSFATRKVTRKPAGTSLIHPPRRHPPGSALALAPIKSTAAAPSIGPPLGCCGIHYLHAPSHPAWWVQQKRLHLQFAGSRCRVEQAGGWVSLLVLSAIRRQRRHSTDDSQAQKRVHPARFFEDAPYQLVCLNPKRMYFLALRESQRRRPVLQGYDKTRSGLFT